MKVLLDECIDHRLAREIPGHDVRHVRALGWASLSDGALLRQAAQRFDVFITVDRGIAFQQDVRGLRLAIVVLRVKRNTLARLMPLVPELVRAMTTAPTGTVTWLEEPS